MQWTDIPAFYSHAVSAVIDGKNQITATALKMDICGTNPRLKYQLVNVICCQGVGQVIVVDNVNAITSTKAVNIITLIAYQRVITAATIHYVVTPVTM